MKKSSVEINSDTKVSDLLDAYPELEETLIGIAPPFKKLKNPFLRKTVAKVATIKNISSVGGVPLKELINKLREATGQPLSDESFDEENYFTEKPDWFSEDKVSLSIDEDKLDDKNKMTLTVILKEAKDVKPGEIIELVTSFLPAPGIDIMKTKGFSVWTMKETDELIKSYFLKNTE